MTGVILEIMHPQIASRSCESCQMYVYDEDSGYIVKNRDGKPRVRAKGNTVPCMTPGMSCPKGSPTEGREFTTKNWQAYNHYLTCKAMGQWPDDELVRVNASLIARSETYAERRLIWQNQKLNHDLLMAMLRR